MEKKTGGAYMWLEELIKLCGWGAYMWLGSLYLAISSHQAALNGNASLIATSSINSHMYCSFV